MGGGGLGAWGRLPGQGQGAGGVWRAWLQGAGGCGLHWQRAREPGSLCGGGGDAGAWELISWSLVSARSLDSSPRLPASPRPASAPSVSLWLPIGPRTHCPPASGAAQDVASTMPRSGQGACTEGPCRGRGRGFCGFSCSWGSEGSSSSPGRPLQAAQLGKAGRGWAPTSLRENLTPAPSSTPPTPPPDSGSGPSGPPHTRVSLGQQLRPRLSGAPASPRITMRISMPPHPYQPEASPTGAHRTGQAQGCKNSRKGKPRMFPPVAQSLQVSMSHRPASWVRLTGWSLHVLSREGGGGEPRGPGCDDRSRERRGAATGQDPQQPPETARDQEPTLPQGLEGAHGLSPAKPGSDSGLRNCRSERFWRGGHRTAGVGGGLFGEMDQ